MKLNAFTLLGGALVLVVALLIVLCVHECNERRGCERDGGHVVEYNCHTVFIPVSCGKGCTILSPTTSCDWRCEGLPAERVSR